MRRQTLAEEHHWRAKYRRTGDWYGKPERAPDWLDVQPPQPWQIAEVYRGLRKGREDRKDEPGAADFYYGEMEMRRQRAQGEGNADATEAVRRVPRAERAIIWLYWLLSGYGLRASRAFGALLVVIALFTTALHLYGFADRVRPYATKTEVRATPNLRFPPSPRQVVDGWGSVEAWTYSFGTATAVIGAPEAQLTQTGRGLRVALRILGPLLIALGLLSIRGRVKR
jgi:hypothetical protein